MSPIAFSDDGGFDFAVRCVLSGVAYGMAELGEVLTAAERVAGGDADAWFETWTELGNQCDRIGARAEAAGHLESAAGAYLRAANYRFAGFYYVLATRRASEHLDAWQAHRRSLDRSVVCSPAIEPFTIPFGNTELRAWRFRGHGTAASRPTLIIHNGLGSPISDVFMTGAIDAVRRGWDAIAFDGPGQGHACFEGGVGPVDDWGPVGRAVVDAMLDHGESDPDRIVASGIADGGYFAAAHAAGDPRVAALVCDPGVLRPVDGALGGLPAAIVTTYESGATITATTDRDTQFTLAKLVEQWPGSSPNQVLDRLTTWNLDALIPTIQVPTLIADPESATAFPGQSGELAARLGTRATLMPFTTNEGAGLDCEIGAPQLRNQRVFDWLDETLPSGD